jgi:uncharacterized membrane protein YeaQ/YmgE (transglycosylase-associated protein family)
MDQITTIIALVVGGIAGWLAAKILKRTGFGLIGDIFVGMVGGYVGAWVWTFLHPPADAIDQLKMVAAAAVGGLVLLVLWRIARR